MENREFISAASLPVAESDEVSVLCLENGAMKQKPAKGLGGGGGDINSIVIRTSFAENGDDGSSIAAVEPVPKGTFARIKEFFTVGGLPCTIAEIHHNTYSEGGSVVDESIRMCQPMVAYSAESNSMPEAIGIEGEIPIILLADDRIMTIEEFEQEMGG